MKNILAIGVLVLLASIVTGREATRSVEPVAPVEKGQVETAVIPIYVDTLKLVRGGRSESIQELFASDAPPPAAPAAPAPIVARVEPVPQAAPTAPPLPFTYLGRMNKGDRAIVYLRKNQQGMVIAESGATLENLYRVEEISDTAVHFNYLPLGTRQVLNLPPAR